MKIAIYQSDIIWESAKPNLEKVERVLEKIQGTCDILVLPEMFTTGFTMNPTAIAEKMDGISIEFLKKITLKYNIAIIGSLIIEQNGISYNRMIFTTPDGNIEYYDKRHLFSMSGEDKHLGAGKEVKIFHYKGFNILPQVCYDLRFPVWSRNNNNKYDIAIYIASWPTPRIKVWDILLQARALENSCYVIGANRVGNDPSIGYNGHSCAIDYMGNKISESQENKEEVIFCEVNKEALNKFRVKFPVHMDADNFELEK